jgi:hypothetical protein
MRYFSIGGRADEFEVNAYFHGLLGRATVERDLVAYAITAVISELSPPTTPHSNR